MPTMKYSCIFEDIEKETEVQTLKKDDFSLLLAKHKALLFRADEKRPFTVKQFAEFMIDLKLDEYPYVGGAAPRRIIRVDGVKDMIYTANEAPPDELIPFHHELAQVKKPPKYLFFYCDLPSLTGGETALIDSTLVYRFVNDNFPEFMEKLKKYGARYVRTLPAEDDLKSPIGRSYFNTYQVSSKEEVEKKLNSIKGLEYQWLPDGSLHVVSEPIPAIRFIEQDNGQAIYQWTFHNSVIAAFLGWQDSRNNRKESVRFGNNDKMDEHLLETIAKFMDENKINYRWKKGDFFAINNRLVMHSRNSFTGPRKVYAAMFGESDIDIHEPFKVPDPRTFGFWRLDDPINNAYDAIKAGYRRIDSACDYGNERETGQGIRRAIEEGICTREELYITTKLWNTYHSPEHVPLAMERSLNDLGLSYVDEYLIHFPISMEFVPFEQKYPPEWTNLEGNMVVIPNDINRTWQAMEALVDAGKTHFIGISNFNCQHIRQVLSIARIRPTSLQIECHPHLNQKKLVRFARENNIRVSAFSPMGAVSYRSLNMSSEQDILFKNSVIANIASKHNKSSAQVMLRWAIQRNTLPISKSSSFSRMKENLSIFDFYLHQIDMKLIDGLNKNHRYNDPGVFCEKSFGTFCPIYE